MPAHFRVCVCVGGGGGGGGGGGRGRNHKAIGFLSNTGLHPLENHKTTKPAFNVGPLLAFRW